MKWDTVWQLIRYALIAFGGIAVGRGWVSEAQMLEIVGAVGIIGAAVWGFFVKSGTSAVPDRVAMKADIPTVSAATGQVVEGSGVAGKR